MTVAERKKYQYAGDDTPSSKISHVHVAPKARNPTMKDGMECSSVTCLHQATWWEEREPSIRAKLKFPGRVRMVAGDARRTSTVAFRGFSSEADSDSQQNRGTKPRRAKR